MLEKINQLLSKLPFNGKKTGIGVALSAILFFFPDFPLAETQIDKIIADGLKIVEYFGNLYVIIGVLHKYIKAKV